MITKRGSLCLLISREQKELKKTAYPFVEGHSSTHNRHPGRVLSGESEGESSSEHGLTTDSRIHGGKRGNCRPGMEDGEEK